MHLISCRGCGVVFNKEALEFPDMWDEEEGTIIEGVGVWTGEKYVSSISCPICYERILEE